MNGADEPLTGDREKGMDIARQRPLTDRLKEKKLEAEMIRFR